MHATLTLASSQVDAGSAFNVTYQTTGVSGSARVYLQRQFGTAKVWKSVRQLKGAEGTVSAPSVQIGEYKYRILILVGRKMMTSATKTLYSYGSIAFGTVCLNHKISNSGNCSTGTAQEGTTILSYAGEFGSQNYPTYDQALSARTTTCRSVTLQFAMQTVSISTAYVQIIQSASDPQAQSTGPGTIGTFSATLDGGPWILNVASSNSQYDYVLINGTFNCYSTTGF
jgi:hypothetical protein